MSQPGSPSSKFVSQTALEGQALLDAIRAQIEFWFSRQNLEKDIYLRNKLLESDANHSVDISVIMAFQKMQNLSQDETVIRQAIASSTLVAVESNKIKLINTDVLSVATSIAAAPVNISKVVSGGKRDIILRDIPGDVPVDEIQDIFRYEGCKPISGCRPESVGNMWYVTFDSEEDAKDTIMQLGLLDRKFRGTKVKARLKPEPSVKAFPGAPINVTPQQQYMYPGPGGPPQTFFNMGAPLHISGGIPVPHVGFGVGDMHFYIDPNAANVNAQVMPVVIPNPSSNFPHMQQHQHHQLQQQQQHNRQGVGGQNNIVAHTNLQAPALKKDSNKPTTDVSTANRNNNNNKDATVSNNSNVNNINNNHAQQNRNKQHEGRNNQPNQQHLQQKSVGARSVDAKHGGNTNINGSNNNSNINNGGGGGSRLDISSESFPPLATSEDSQGPGFKGSYVKYKQDEIIEIVRKVADAKIPGELNPDKHPLAMGPSPNLDLLQRQRSYSIDEAKEQLQQGKPIHQVAVIVPDLTATTGVGTASSNTKTSGGSSNNSNNNASAKQPLTVKAAFSSWASVAKTEVAATPKAVSTSSGRSSVGAPVVQTAKAASIDSTGSATGSAVGAGGRSEGGSRKDGKKERDGSGDQVGKDRSGSGSRTGGGGSSGQKERSRGGERGDDKKDANKNQSEQKDPPAPVESSPAPNTWAKNLFKQ